ncbi:hypothetical protein AciPR4_2334 [Terriglobus saanensis SP1PR4]|uniref:Uncharacterized protein n=1 Tax=Terriglobus saanensis (strain ATCC BAA-1853 / DSM 23119 / SP1PR4) TaxID=401053 RepID=E8UXV6_TERSS|nr:hypothetical protein AciPR4_2334 [Terriglobus saanensis SP1PR4]
MYRPADYDEIIERVEHMLTLLRLMLGFYWSQSRISRGR